jgi:hypothetical protein
MADMMIEEAAELLGYEKCDWPPEEGECEGCGKKGLQDYAIRMSIEYNEYEYRCPKCVVEHAECAKRRAGTIRR